MESWLIQELTLQDNHIIPSITWAKLFTNISISKPKPPQRLHNQFWHQSLLVSGWRERQRIWQQESESFGPVRTIYHLRTAALSGILSSAMDTWSWCTGRLTRLGSEDDTNHKLKTPYQLRTAQRSLLTSDKKRIWRNTVSNSKWMIDDVWDEFRTLPAGISLVQEFLLGEVCHIGRVDVRHRL